MQVHALLKKRPAPYYYTGLQKKKAGHATGTKPEECFGVTPQ
ncbi:hypothetical protein [Desulfovibrio cuneatus]|nr:hypothetical protein [Desulfovibrio cuneatus]